jgi:Leucine-rich repeat (LRR) protein
LSENKISSLCGLPVSLLVLTLDGNRLRQLDDLCFFPCQNLRFLSLKNNQIEDLPSSVFDLSLLLVLDFSLNELTYMPPLIGRLQRLEKLFLYKNKITVFPKEMNIPSL